LNQNEDSQVERSRQLIARVSLDKLILDHNKTNLPKNMQRLLFGPHARIQTSHTSIITELVFILSVEIKRKR